MKRFSCGSQKASLSFYTLLPVQDISYETLREKAIGRVNMLRRIEASIGDLSLPSSMEEDLVGHACLKLICCQSRWASGWFVSMEAKLFRLRLDRDPAAANEFFQEEFWPHIGIGEDFQERASPCSSFDPLVYNPFPFASGLKVHFSKCSDLLARRTHDLRRGYFSFNKDVMKSWMAGEFKRYLSARVDALHSQLSTHPDERFERLAKELFVETQAGGAPAKDALSKESLFPLCMKGILARMRTEKHLKYSDRQALCLFLKDIGVQLQDTINFFKMHFTLPADQFNKNYLYTIRHNYGLEGRRANYSSFTCAKLIGMANDASAFGCPFVKNTGFVKQHIDIEDVGRDIGGCCAKVGAKYAGKELGGVFASPADYYRLSEKAADASG